MHYYQFNIGDYASHTQRLTLLEDLAYRRLLDEYYLHERPLNGCLTDVARQIGMRDNEDEVDVVLRKYFFETPEGWINKRADKEIAHFHDKAEKASKAGKASALQRTLHGRSTDVQPNINHKPITNNHKPITNNQEPIKTKPISVSDETSVSGFEQFWQAYPKKTGKQAALKAWIKVKDKNKALESSLQALRWQTISPQWVKDNGQYIPNPATYINQGRWDDVVVSVVNDGLSDVGRKTKANMEQWLREDGVL